MNGARVTRAVEALWRPESPLARAGHALLLPLSVAFRAIVARRNRAWDTGRAAIERVETPVVSVGNLSVGGSGKTPFVLWLVEELLRRGLRPVVVSRGYGGSSSKPLVLLPHTALRPEAARLAGDEAVMIARRSGVPVAVATRRIDACLAARDLAADVFILDDGFQHRALARDLDIVLVTGEEATAALLPAGPLREPPSSLARAGVVVDASGQGKPGQGPSWALPYCPGALQVTLERRPLALVERVAPDARKQPVSDLAGARIVALAGIGRSQGFFAMLEAAGAEILRRLVYPDHAAYDAADWKRIRAAALDADFVVTTEKDLVKLAAFAPEAGFLRALRLGVSVGGGEAVVEKIVDIVRQVRFDPRGG